MTIINCACCGQEFNSIRPTNITCSNICYNKLQDIKRSQAREGQPDILRCLECNLLVGKTLTAHLRSKHNMTATEYKEKHNVGTEALFANSTRDKLSENSSGENNAWFNHGGKLSPFSKNNNRITEEERKQNQNNAIQNRIDNGNNTTSLEYYLKKTSDAEEARKMLRDRQSTFSLEKCIEKYGGEEGKRIWEERQNKWQDTLCNKSQEEITVINNKKRQSRYSKISQDLFNKLNKKEARYYEQNGEIGIKGKSRVFYPDFVLNKKIIEFFGDRWHANPKKYNENEYMQTLSKNKEDLLISDIWKKDKNRIDQLIDLGYEVLIVWENDYRSNPEGIIKKCLEFLNK
jgi:G:T-mismatch repair DNA endonuclease (very short patch repair protein)